MDRKEKGTSFHVLLLLNSRNFSCRLILKFESSGCRVVRVILVLAIYVSCEEAARNSINRMSLLVRSDHRGFSAELSIAHASRKI